MVEKILTVKNRAGIHARPAAIIAQTANKFACEVTLSRDDSDVNAKSIMGIFSLDLSKPIDLNIHAEDDAADVMEVIKNYLV